MSSLSFARRVESRLSHAQKNGFLELVFSVLRRAAAVGDISRDVTLGVKKFTVDDAKKTCPITVPEFDSILVHVAPARRALFRLLLDSGLRISEALALEWSDIRETSHGHLRSRNSGKKTRQTVLPQAHSGLRPFPPLHYSSFRAKTRRSFSP